MPPGEKQAPPAPRRARAQPPPPAVGHRERGDQPARGGDRAASRRLQSDCPTATRRSAGNARTIGGTKPELGLTPAGKEGPRVP